MSKITFADEGWEDYLCWQQQDKKTLKKINDLLKSIERDGVLKGKGKPERLKYRDGDCSRRIDDFNRLVYEVVDGEIIVKSCKGHYEE